MRGVNKVILVGTLGKDPEMRYTAGGAAVCNLSLATNHKWKNKQTNEWQEETEWHRIVLFGNSAENAGKFLTKGSQAYIEGRIQTRKWQDNQGQDRWTTEVVGHDIQFLGGGRQSQQPNNQGQPSQQGQSQQQQQPQQQQSQPQHSGNPTGAPPSNEDWEDDIPF